MDKFKITHFEEIHKKLLINFNKRISSANLSFSDPENWQFAKSNKFIKQDFYVLTENSEIIRAITAIKNQNYYLKGEIINFQDIQLPISESIINFNYISQTIYFIKYISSLSSNMHALGMGGLKTSLPKILMKNKFKSFLIPFFSFPISITSLIQLIIFNKFKFKIHPRYLFLILGLDRIRKFVLIKFHKCNNINIELFSKFNSTDSLLWNTLKSNFDLIAVKDDENLNELYCNSPHDLLKYRVSVEGRYFGYMILKITKHSNNKYFLNSKTLTIVDMLCENKHYFIFIKMIKKIALVNNCDLILVNSTYEKFNSVLSKSLFITLPSNFGFVYKTENTFNILNSWITRADGDGPINL
jgi:hypothetical protein